ncbi:RIP metalloprotease [Brevundimonas sp. Leaf363]|uniref:M50 family metallopeptidase n=1 Tax=Brevundimonas sp. Leaf363 TaxID=1736353 RepID=UPI001F1E9E15|nr:M50 family metallopeptidase [Brevundimonas sp. Leaf363]
MEITNGMLGVLSQIVTYVLPFLVVLTTVVTIHELGHFLVARWCGVKIDRFAIGFGKAIFSRTDRHGVEWRVAWLPLGGYVKFAGDLDASSVPDREGLDRLRSRIIAEQGPGAERVYFHFKPVWQRALVTVAGPVANFILAFVLFTVLFSIVGEQIVAPRVFAVAPGSPAAAAGFQSRDLITAVNGRPVHDGSEVTGTVMLSAGEPIRFTVDRGGRPVELTATPQRVEIQDQVAGRVKVARIGLDLRPLVGSDISIRRLNPIEAAAKGVDRIGEVLGTTLRYLGRIVTGRESGDMLNGPIGIATAAGGITKQASDVGGSVGDAAISVGLNLVQLAAILSIGIGFLNLLPIPILDGGHLVFYAYEAVARRPVAARVQEAGYRVGLALLAGLMLFATWNDLQKLNLFKFLGGLVS